ncbi:hypothetical protein E4T47_02107 [Aureobasidium subglaciale]|nr:hypothetical protein E4T47_02107 [Aureobasidium subglaciale]
MSTFIYCSSTSFANKWVWIGFSLNFDVVVKHRVTDSHFDIEHRHLLWLAYYLGGCCQVGRNCDTTSCPTSASTAVITNSGLTVIAPSGASSAVLTGSCANGWFSCAASVGGGCCPSGYGCGASCTAMTSGESNIGKGAPSEASYAKRCGWALLSLATLSGAGMIFL